MNTNTIANATEYRNLPLALLTESKTNPRRTFEDDSLKELAESIRTQGILSPPASAANYRTGFEIVFGARRYRAAQMAEAATVPVRIKNLTDAEALEAQLIENPPAPRRSPDGGGQRLPRSSELGRSRNTP